MVEQEFVKHLIKRLSRIDASEGWAVDLNPVQKAALEYLSRANRFSRKPSQVAEFLASTRGTVSQTLKALARKGYIEEVKSKFDKRSISYDLTALGVEAVTSHDVLSRALKDVSKKELLQVSETLNAILGHAIANNGQRPFGLCRNCEHFQVKGKGGYCGLLEEPLAPAEITRICFEQQPRMA